MVSVTTSPSGTNQNSLLYDPEEHRYYVGGIEIPSTSAILDLLHPVFNRQDSDFFKDRGKYLHECVALCRHSKLDVESLDPEDRGYVQAWIQFENDHPHLTTKSLIMEAPIFSAHRHRFFTRVA